MGQMTALNMDNPVFMTYVITASLMVLKLMGQGWMTVYRMIKSDSGLVSPEDLQPGPANRTPRPEQLETNDYVDRSRRMHRNDLENIPAFLAIGLIFVIATPPAWLAHLLMYGFVIARLSHSIAYATKQRHETRAMLFTFGSVSVVAMAIFSLEVAVS